MHARLRSILRPLAILAALLPAACGGGGAPGPLRAGAGVALLPIPIGHSHAGYLQSDALGAPHPPDDPGSPFADLFPATRSIQSPPRAKALVLERGGARLVLAQVDTVFVTAVLTARVLARARERLGVDLDGQLLLHASHTHGGPGRFSFDSPRPSMLASAPAAQRPVLVHGADTFSAESTDRVAAGVVEAIGRALATLEPARFGWAKGASDDASRDRRCHDDWLTGKGDRDRALTVLRVDALDGSPIAVLVHFAMHGTIYDHDSRALGVDAPGHVAFALERRFDEPVVAIFLQGAAAAASPNADTLGHAGSQAMERVGALLADEAMALYEAIETDDAIDLQVAIRREPIDARRLGYPPGAFPEDGALLCHLLDSTCGAGPRDPAALDCLGRVEPGGGKYETWIGAARVGDLAILALPGEPSAAMGRRLAEAAAAHGFAHAIPLGYSLDHDGYLLLADDWLSGGSETNITFWGWRYADHLVERSAALLAALEAGPFVRSDALRPASAPDWRYRPVAPSPSATAPAVVEEPPSVVERMEEVRFAFHGGDPALGTPDVRLQRRIGDRWEDALVAGWIPVGNLHGPELPTFYEATPAWREHPAPTPRAHRWHVVYEPPRDLPAGAYRFHARGAALVDGEIRDWELRSSPFEVVPSTRMRVEAAIVDGALEATLLHPVRAPVWSDAPRSAGWQVGGFRAVDVRFDPAFVPALAGEAIRDAETDAGTAALRFVARTAPAGRWAPGEGPGFRAVLPPGAGAVRLPAGTLRDAHGNTHGADVEVGVSGP